MERRPAVKRMTLLLSILVGCGGDRSPARPPEPTFSGGVAALIYERCATCHRPAGAAPFALLTYEEVREHGERIVRMTTSGRMPPWQPSRPVGVFLDERRLAPDEVELLQRWVDGGMPIGEASAVPEPPQWTEEWSMGAPDMIVELETPYVVPADQDEMFRNFVLPVSLDRTRWVRAVELKPGGPRVVHHATVALDATHASRDLDARDPGPGFDGMGSAGGAEHPGGVFIGWTPGKSTAAGAAPMSWALHPGADLVARLHLRPADHAVEIRPSVGLYFADAPPERLPVAVQLGYQAIDIPAGEPAYEVRDSFPLDVPVDVLSLYPHAHYLGRLVQAWADTPAGERIWLLEIPDWDFNWQDEYRFREPVRLPAGSMLHMRYTYDNTSDNSRNPSDPPVRVTYGPRSVDEMADLIVQTLPLSRDGTSVLSRAVDRKVAAIKLEGYELALREQGEDARLRYNMGIAEAARGNAAEAETQLRRATTLDPRFAEAFINLGIVLHQQGRVAEALASYERAIRLAPDEPRAHHDAGVALQELGRIDEAERSFRRAIAADPSLAVSHKQLGRLLEARGDLPRAIESYRMAAEHGPDDPETPMWLGRALAATGDGVGALERFRTAAELAPGSPRPLLAMADLLAGYPDPAVHRPDEAVRLAERAAELTGRRDPVALLSLANALGAAGSVPRAIETGEEALAIARQANVASLVRAIETRLARLRQEGR